VPLSAILVKLPTPPSLFQTPLALDCFISPFLVFCWTLILEPLTICILVNLLWIPSALLAIFSDSIPSRPFFHLYSIVFHSLIHTHLYSFALVSIHSHLFALVHTHLHSFALVICIHSHSFALIHTHLHLFAIIHTRSHSFTLVHTHSHSFAFVRTHLHSLTLTCIHSHSLVLL
jgi:hypothetical protein